MKKLLVFLAVVFLIVISAFAYNNDMAQAPKASIVSSDVSNPAGVTLKVRHNLLHEVAARNAAEAGKTKAANSQTAVELGSYKYYNSGYSSTRRNPAARVLAVLVLWPIAALLKKKGKTDENEEKAHLKPENPTGDNNSFICTNCGKEFKGEGQTCPYCGGEGKPIEKSGE